MPAYKNRPPLSSDTQVWHYTSLPAVVAILKSGKLRLTRLDAFPDPFEGSIPKKQYEDQQTIFMSNNDTAVQMLGMPVRRSPNLDPWTKMTQNRQARIRCAHAICWTHGDESEAMWRLYCRDGRTQGQGLALRMTLGKLEASVTRHDLYVSPIWYRYYHVGAAFDNDLDPFFYKRRGFVHEREVRLLKFDEEHYSAHLKYLYPDYISGDPPTVPPTELKKHIKLDWSLSDAIGVVIVVSPYASDAYESKAREAIEAIAPAVAARMELSELSERRYKRYL